MASTVTSKGQVTIPKAVRDMLGIKPGSKVEFRRASNGGVLLLRADGNTPPSRFGLLKGHAGEGMDTDSVMALTRGAE